PSGLFTIKVTDTSNPAHVYMTSFTNPASYGGPIGFRRAGPDFGDGQYDDISIAAIPEPGTLFLAGAGILGLLGYGWRQRKPALKGKGSVLWTGPNAALQRPAARLAGFFKA